MNTMLLSIFSAFIFSGTAFTGTHLVSYEVPVPVELAAFSKFEVEYTATKLDDGTTKLVYRLPRLLLGRDAEFQFLGRVDFGASHFELRAPDAEMRCEPERDAATCRVKYRAVRVDLDGVREALEALPLTPAEREGRFEVASRVAAEGGDFAGVIRFIRDPEYRLLGK